MLEEHFDLTPERIKESSASVPKRLNESQKWMGLWQSITGFVIDPWVTLEQPSRTCAQIHMSTSPEANGSMHRVRMYSQLPQLIKRDPCHTKWRIGINSTTTKN